ncbi:MAG: hypothetical protein RLZZ502_1150 [Pseudomonadota bacterium]
MKLRTQAGFTLIEVMVVMLILGILAALIVPNVLGRSDDAKVMAAQQDVATLSQALKLYRLDNNHYPSQTQGLQALLSKPSGEPVPGNWKPGGYIERLPKDPWGNAYQYSQPGLKGEFDLFSFGADGKAGGEGNNKDVGNWKD